MKALFLLALSIALPACLPAAVIYGVKSDPGLYSWSSSPIPSSVIFASGRRQDSARVDDSIGLRMDVVDWATGANLIEATRNELVTVFSSGPIQPTYAIAFDWIISGDYSLGTQSTGFVSGRYLVGATGTTPGGLSGSITGGGGVFSIDLGDRSLAGLATSGTFSRTSTIVVPLPVTGAVSIGLSLQLSAMNNGYVNALNSLHFGAARVIDTSTGQTVTGATINSESGFDWSAPLPASSVPEPATAGLVAGAGLLFWLVKRR